MKEMYEAKARYAARKFNESAALADNKLSNAQLNTIASVTNLRHWWHCNGAEALTNPEASENAKARKIAEGEWLGSDELATVASLECGTLYTPAGGDDIHDVDDWYYVMEEKEQSRYADIDEFKSECYAKNGEIVERINNEIEAWLRRVDEKFGTCFAPTGMSRIF